MLPTDQLTQKLTVIAESPDFRDVEPAGLLGAHRKSQRHRVLLVAAVMAVAALGTGLAIGNTSWRVADGPGQYATQAPDGSETLAARTLAAMTPEERVIITRGPIVLADYRRTVGRTVDCLRTNGFTVTEPVLRNGQLEYMTSHSAEAPGASGPDINSRANVTMDAKVAACSQLSNAVGAVWFLDHPPNDGSFPYPHLKELVAELRQSARG